MSLISRPWLEKLHCKFSQHLTQAKCSPAFENVLGYFASFVANNIVRFQYFLRQENNTLSQ